jgi:hypothetical protein
VPVGFASAANCPIYLDSDDNILKVIPAGTGTTEVQIIDASSVQTLTGKTLTAPVITGAFVNPSIQTLTADGAITIASGVVLLSRASQATLASVAAPGAGGVGVRMTIIGGTDFAHVITFTGATLWDGTTGANTTVTMTAFRGSAITVVGQTATVWLVESQNVLTSIA